MRLELEEGDLRCIPRLISIINGGHYFPVAIIIEGDISMSGLTNCTDFGVIGVKRPPECMSESLTGNVDAASFHHLVVGANLNFEFEPVKVGMMSGQCLSNRIVRGSNPFVSSMAGEKEVGNMGTLPNSGQKGSMGTDGLTTI